MPAEWLASARAALKLYGEHPGVAFADLAAEVVTEVRLFRAVQAELAGHERAREATIGRWTGRTCRSLPGSRPSGDRCSSHMGEATDSPVHPLPVFTGLAPKASETGNTDRKGRPCPRPATPAADTLIRAATPPEAGPAAGRIY